MSGRTYLNVRTTVWSWMSTRDHKRIGVMFLAATSLMLLLGGIFALLLRIELLTPREHDHERHDLQPPVHAARRDHGLALHDPVHPRGASATSCSRS